MYQELKGAWRLERSSFKLHQMSPDFYQKLRTYLDKFSSALALKRGLSKKVALIEFEVIRALAQDLFSLRIRKALMQAIEGHDPLPYLTKEEAEALEKVLKALNEAEASLSELLLARVERTELRLVRLLREVPEDKAPGFAPLSTESLALLPADIADRLISEDYAVALE
ncbi:MAG: hypothetical protein QXT74_00155 [Candidatus Nezhaarchaeales archaeon]